MSISINPQAVNNASGSFSASTYGYTQGLALDDPALSNELVATIVASTVSGGLYGGMAITESMVAPAGSPKINSGLKTQIILATAETNITGFTVFNGAHAMVNSPSSPVPLSSAGMGINIFRLGSGIRIPVAISAANAATLQGEAINTAVYWDYTNQVLLLAPGGTALPVKVVDVSTANNQVVSYSAGSGTWGNPTYPAIAVIQI